MKIVIFGATGRIGSRLLSEALARGHEVTVIAREPARLQMRQGLTVKKGDLRDEAALIPLVAGHDAVLTAVHFTDADAEKFLRIVRGAGVARLLVTGGAGSLLVAPERQLVDSPDFPAAFRAEAEAGRAFLQSLQACRDVEWTFLSPSLVIVPGERTGRFRLGRDELLRDDAGNSRISMEDFAMAMLDELEQPRHAHARFTVGY
ncbi:NAD(P)-dependent oxidoreductase [Azohydromonas aeria]|uniref:NAD(P)-dependent oxidoreductase n=1 Tax=Azohydromonas aeria TaxID=2590212 RepID=UPI0012F735D6|nr:NAD(P)-dependent oxidoreductase [Azohydromonas aeria]